jgi:hypothetical protein
VCACAAIAVAVAAAAAAAGVQSHQGLAAREMIASLFDAWNQALATKDPNKVADLYAHDAVLLPTVSNEVRQTVQCAMISSDGRKRRGESTCCRSVSRYMTDIMLAALFNGKTNKDLCLCSAAYISGDDCV